MNLRKQKGFSIMEVMVATGILAGAILTLQASWSGSIRSVRKSTALQTVGRLLENKMTEIEVKYRNNMSELPEEDGGEFEGYPDYRWEMKSVKFVAPDFSSLMQQEGGADPTMLDVLKRMTKMFEDNIKEVEVAVYVKLSGKELRFHVTSLFIDYEKPINLMDNL